MDFDKQIDEMDENIRIMEGRRKYLYKCYQIQSYKERMELIGKCYKHNNAFYKIVDLDINDKYMCFVLTFIKGDFDIEDMQECYSMFKSAPFTENIGELGLSGIRIENLLITDLTKNSQEIPSEEFNKEYFSQCEQILGVDKFLLADRLQRIKNEEENNGCNLTFS